LYKECHGIVPPPFGSGGGAHSLAGEGVWESEFKRGDIHCGTLGIYVQYVLCDIHSTLKSSLVDPVSHQEIRVRRIRMFLVLPDPHPDLHPEPYPYVFGPLDPHPEP
jgi:hypothetical protein